MMSLRLEGVFVWLELLEGVFVRLELKGEGERWGRMVLGSS